MRGNGSERQKLAASILIPVIGGQAAAFLGGKVFLRLTNRGYGNAPLDSHPVLHHVHPSKYTFRVHSPSGEFGGHIVRYDEDGLTSDPDASAVDPASARYRVAFLGDSYVEATQVPYSRSFVGRLQSLAGPAVGLRNYRVSGYSPLLYNVQWREQVRDFSPTHVFLLVFFNDIADDAALIDRAVSDGTGRVTGWRRRKSNSTNPNTRKNGGGGPKATPSIISICCRCSGRPRPRARPRFWSATDISTSWDTFWWRRPYGGRIRMYMGTRLPKAYRER